MMDASTRTAPLYGGIPVRNVWHMLLYVWGYPEAITRWRGEAERAATLDALLANVLEQNVKQRLRVGLGREYVEVQEPLRGIRGRIDLNRSLRERRFERGQALCRYTSFVTDAPRNQIIRSVMAKLVRVGRFGRGPDARELRQRLRRTVRDLDGITLVEVDSSLIRRQRLGRNDRDYALMLSICELIVDELLPTTHPGVHTRPWWDHDKQALERLFEAFVAEFYRLHLPHWDVAAQPRWRWPAQHPRLPQLIPDLVLDAPGCQRRIVLDTKFTSNNLVAGRFDTFKFDTGHLYQLYAYLRTQEERDARHANAVGVLLYPAIDRMIRERFTVQGHDVLIATVDLSARPEAVERELLDLIGSLDTPSEGTVVPSIEGATTLGDVRR